MPMIYLEDAQRLIGAQRIAVPELMKKHKPTSVEQGMYAAFNIAQKCLLECQKRIHKMRWHDASTTPPKRDGLYLTVFELPSGTKRVRTSWYVDGEWKEAKCEITHWGLMPKPPEDEEEDEA